MSCIKFSKQLYSKIALLKSAYNFTDRAYIHIDCDENYYIVNIIPKNGELINENDFNNEMLMQSVRHEVYLQTKNIRELLFARAMSTSLVMKNNTTYTQDDSSEFKEDEIIKDWFKNGIDVK